MGIRSRLRIRTRLRSFMYRIWPPEPKPLILTYHRIADEPVDFFRLAVSPARFEEQLDVLRRTRHPLPLAQFVHDLVSGTLPPNAVALTLDDGYLDNLEAGKPRLVAADVPATVFLATGFVNRPERLWWDELARLILFTSTPRSFELPVQGKSMQFDFGMEPAARADGATRAALLTRRHAALWTLRQTLRLLEDGERRAIMAKIRSVFAGHNDRSSLCRAMTSEEVRALVAGGLVTVGAHTITHPVLTELEPATCYREISDSKLACEAIIGEPVAGFAYPYGDFDDKAREAVKSAGFSFACSARNGPAVPTSDIFALPRVHVLNWDGDAFEQALRFASAAG
jgi:peptidoglycan/xylan/chitin deacetylase (PgdA/CDA1 family)